MHLIKEYLRIRTLLLFVELGTGRKVDGRFSMKMKKTGIDIRHLHPTAIISTRFQFLVITLGGITTIIRRVIVYMED